MGSGAFPIPIDESMKTHRSLQRHLCLGLATLAVGAARVLAAEGSGDAPPILGRPNIVVIIADDLRWDALGCNGSPHGATPNIDRLAREGVNLRNFFVTTPLCSPSRASFLTGLYARRHYIINNDKPGLDVIGHTLLTWPRLLRQNGYETAFIGKWHMGLDDSRRMGWDHWISFKGQGAYRDAVVNDNGVSRQLSGNTTDFLNTRAVEFIRQRHDQPFVLWLAHKAVHLPYLPTKRNEARFAEAKYTPPPNSAVDPQGKPAMARKLTAAERVNWLTIEGAQPEPGESRYGRGRDRDSIMRDQLRCLADVDDGVGAVLDALRASGALDHTLVIFTSDNGYLLGEFGEFDTKRWAYEPSIRQPFVLRYPRLVPPGSVRDQLVLNVDVAPFMLELAGVAPPERMHGRSFLPVLKDAKAPWREAFLAEYFVEKISPRCPEWQAVRTTRWKFIHYPAFPAMGELYNLETDPLEQHNVIAVPDAAAALAELRSQLTRLLSELN